MITKVIGRTSEDKRDNEQERSTGIELMDPTLANSISNKPCRFGANCSSITHKAMRRLFQLATIMLLVACFLAPISEFFDQWDPEGLTNDAEFGFVALVFVLCLVTLVTKLIAAGSFRVDFRSVTLKRTVDRRSS